MLQRRIRKPYVYLRKTDSDSRERKSYTINHQQFMIWIRIHIQYYHTHSYTNAIHNGIKNTNKKKISPRGHIAHLRNISYNSNQLCTAFGTKTRYPIQYKQRDLSAQYQSISINYYNHQQLLKIVMPDYLFQYNSTFKSLYLCIYQKQTFT